MCHRLGCESPVQACEVVLDYFVVVEDQREYTDRHREDVTREDRRDLEYSDIGGRLYRLRRVAEQFGGVDQFEDAQNGGQDGEGRI